MINKYLKGLIVVLICFVLFVLSSYVVLAVSEKTTWCHCEPNGNCQTLELTDEALSGHVDAQGNILHAGDHAGVCEEEPTPTPTLTPTPEVTPTPTPEETITPTPTVEVTPTPAETTTNTGGPGDGRSDNLGCGSHDCSNQQQQTTQAVLGASTGPQVLGLSTTSSGSNSLLNLFQLLGASTLSVFGFSFLKKNA